MTPPGIQDIKQVDLYLKYRRFILKTYWNDICPKPSADKIQRIKSQRLATSQKRLEKLKAIQDTVGDDDDLRESDDIVRDDDESGVYVVVNEENSGDGGESNITSSSGSDSVAEE